MMWHSSILAAGAKCGKFSCCVLALRTCHATDALQSAWLCVSHQGAPGAAVSSARTSARNTVQDAAAPVAGGRAKPALPMYSRAPTQGDAARTAARHRNDAKLRHQDAFDPPDDNSNAPFKPQLDHLSGLMDESPADTAAATADAGPSTGSPAARGQARLRRHAEQLNASPLKARAAAACAFLPMCAC